MNYLSSRIFPLEGFDFTVDEALGRMSMLHREKGRLYALFIVFSSSAVIYSPYFFAIVICFSCLFKTHSIDQTIFVGKKAVCMHCCKCQRKPVSALMGAGRQTLFAGTLTLIIHRFFKIPQNSINRFEIIHRHLLQQSFSMLILEKVPLQKPLNIYSAIQKQKGRSLWNRRIL